MNQSTTFVLGMTGLMLLFWVMGIIPENATANSTLLSTLTNPSNLQNSGVIIKLLLYLGTAIGGLVLGIFVKDYQFITRIPIGIYLIALMWDFVIVYLKVAAQGTVIAVIALLFFAPLLWVWVLTAIDFIFGRD